MPLFEIDSETPFTGHILFSIMHWPYNKLVREEYLVTAAAQHMQRVKDNLPILVEMKLKEAAAQISAVGASSIEKIMEKIDRDRAKSLTDSSILSLNTEIDKHLFRPYGSFGRVATAEGVDNILKDAASKGRLGAACGEILIYVVMMEMHRNCSPG